jgi:superfamily II DNA or RNA helicase
MSIDNAESRTLVAPGELRPDILKLLGEEVSATDVLLAAPGLMEPYPRHAELVRHPGSRLAKAVASEHLSASLEQFAKATDRLPQTAPWERTILHWIDALQREDVRVRHFGQHPVHSRLLAFAQRSVVPQAPLTLDLADSEHELRVELLGEEHRRARSWFEGLFERSTDISDELEASLRCSWAGGWCAPRDLYFYVLSQYFSDVIDPGLSGEDDNPMLAHLTEFQREAYDYAKSILSKYGGVFLADVVGLGKTFIALALLSHLQRRYNEHAVVIAPPSVLPAWAELANEFRIEIATVSLGKLEELERFADREIVVVDESHNFRNKGTLRSEVIREWLRPGGVEAASRKAILLSATPQNNDATDLENQINFFPDNRARLPYRGEGLSAFLREVSAGRASPVELLQQVVVRRTRNYIRERHPSAKLRVLLGPGRYEERPLVFPTRVSGEEQCLRYSLDRTYGGDFFDEVLGAIGTMRYPMQGLGAYVLESKAADPRVAGLRRAGTSVRGLFRVLLLKRLESSTHALHTTLGRLADKLVKARERVEQGVGLEAPGRAQSSDELDEVAWREQRILPLDLFDTERLLEDVDADQATLGRLLDGLGTLMRSPDEKLLRLEAYLGGRAPRQHRTLVFTQFAHTAEYLADALGSRFGRTEVVTGSSGGVMKKARRFAPLANRVEVPEDKQIDLLITTDTLSEGVNLQDADTLINYDLHWNPLRLIQRAGRIDRIGSEHEEIHIASFLPQRALEANLRLEAVLRRRIQEFIAAFGEDSAVLPSSEELDVHEMQSAYTGSALEATDKSDELDALSRHVDELFQLRKEDPTEFSRIQAMRPGRRALGRLDATVAATRFGFLWEFWRPGAGGGVERIPVRQAFDALARQSEAGPSDVEPRGGLGLEFIEQVRRAFEPVAKEHRQQQAEPRLSAQEMFVLSALEAVRADAPPIQVPLLERMHRWVRSGHAQSVVQKQARSWKRDKLSPRVVVDELRPLVARFPAPPQDDSEPEFIGAVLPELSVDDAAGAVDDTTGGGA